MDLITLKWLRKAYHRIVTSIAFYTVIIALGFLFLSWVMLMIDFSEWGKSAKAQWNWLRLKDASTARTITSTIAAAVISLTVFSFSMVMIILNQAASQMSNRTLGSMIGNRFQQIVLGFYIGTITYSLFLLSSVRDLDSGILVPSISVYLLIFLTVVDLFLFIYFLHYITQTVKYSTIINRIHNQTKNTLDNLAVESQKVRTYKLPNNTLTLTCPKSGYFQGFQKKGLLKWTQQHNAVVQLLYPVGSFLLKDTPFMIIYRNGTAKEEDYQNLWESIDFFNDQSPGHHYFYGFLHLAEVTIKALSPGINDPSTAVLSLHALSDLFANRLQHHQPTEFYDDDDSLRIIQKEWQFEELYHKCIVPIWHYGKNDPFIKDAMAHLLQQFTVLDVKSQYRTLFAKLEAQLRLPEKSNVVQIF